MSSKENDKPKQLGLALGALGIVYGDIGTSPLYALRECFAGTHQLTASPNNIVGVLSTIFWSLLLIVTLKYIILVMRADNKGEGGVLALTSLAFPERRNREQFKFRSLLVGLGVFGACMLYGDGMITPAISVLSAVEGLEVVTPNFKPYVLPITLVILVCLFAAQRHGTHRVGAIFGPITLVWFVTLAILGLRQIVDHPSVLTALNPYYAVRLFMEEGYEAFVVLGSVILVVTGGEALYADMGHFGRGPIRLAWGTVVLPSLMLNYLGQGALLLSHPEGVKHMFYSMAPAWALLPLVILATAATVIASQALISGAFSLTLHAMQLGYIPRLQVDHTSEDTRGQIYLPRVNWTLMVCCIGLVLYFKSSTNLASAYGIMVSATMVITTILFYFAARRLWGWNKAWLLPLCLFLGAIEVSYFAANTLKIADGGWFPIVVALLVYGLMTTWKRGRKEVGERLKASSLPLETFLEDVSRNPPHRVKGTAIFMSGNPTGTPLALLHNLRHNKVLHERVIILTLATSEDARVDPSERIEVEKLPHNFIRVIGNFGFMEDPNVFQVLKACEAYDILVSQDKTTFFLSRESIVAGRKSQLSPWRRKLFEVMSRNAQGATSFFRLPPNRVVELGIQVEI